MNTPHVAENSWRLVDASGLLYRHVAINKGELLPLAVVQHFYQASLNEN